MWQFLYITKEKVEEEIKGYPQDYDYDEFLSISDNFEQSCKEFDKFSERLNLWDVDSESKNTETGECRCIKGVINYVF